MDRADGGPAGDGEPLLDRRPCWWTLVRPLAKAGVAALAVWAGMRLLPGGGFLGFVKLAILVQAVKVLLVVGVVPVLRWLRCRHVLTGDRLALRQGVLRSRIWSVPLARVRSFSVEAGRVQRRLGAGNLVVVTDTGETRAFKNFPDIDLARRELSRTRESPRPDGETAARP
ncbi:PH domain-containing protein [Actinomadura opuntiae]|uniref:PH domain-containing protein n=1 Tax=Actinomadura sp. OS1-43 TaxID=604315 RepID=UPI00255ABB23|nr:PH domain-containing protein [Actinomadura sp. OS1-43]MDL4815420.1 PH domain-containing protein [Actinomadura sp. OS1-43]